MCTVMRPCPYRWQGTLFYRGARACIIVDSDIGET
jgi:hypothetical protein